MNKIIPLFVICFTLFFQQIGISENSSLTFLNRILNSSEKDTDKSLQRLSGGKILLTDDPANYAIYEMLEKHIRGLDRTIANQNDMLSYYQVHEGLLGNITDILQRIRELTLQKMNGILSDSDKKLIDSEIEQQYDQIIFTLENAEFNKKKLFSDLMASDLIKNKFKEPEHYQLDQIDRLLVFFVRERSYIGAKMRGLEFAVAGERTANENMQEVQSHGDTDYEVELNSLKRSELSMLINVLMLKREK